jgi:hypothetical protein
LEALKVMMILRKRILAVERMGSHKSVAKARLAELAVVFAERRLATRFCGRFAFASAGPFHLN